MINQLYVFFFVVMCQFFNIKIIIRLSKVKYIIVIKLVVILVNILVFDQYVIEVIFSCEIYVIFGIFSGCIMNFIVILGIFIDVYILLNIYVFIWFYLRNIVQFIWFVQV